MPMIQPAPACTRNDARIRRVVNGRMRSVEKDGEKRLVSRKMTPPHTSCWWRSVPPSKLSWRDPSWRVRTAHVSGEPWGNTEQPFLICLRWENIHRILNLALTVFKIIYCIFQF